MNIYGLGRTDIGLLRASNEDAFLADSDLGIFAVCDGMGGHAAGDIASAMTISSIERSLKEQREAIVRTDEQAGSAPALTGIVANALRHACREVHAKASSDPGLAGMGCTATVLVAAGTSGAMAHVGDTRLYLIRGGQAHQLSSDHTMAAELVRRGTLEPGQERGHPQSHVLTRAIGPQELVDVETLAFDLAAGDRFVLCSDGLSGHIPSPQWLAERSASAELEDLPDDLVDFALSCGGSDNITVIAVDVGQGLPAGERRGRSSSEQLLGIVGSTYLFSDLSLAQLTRVLDRAVVEHREPGNVVRNHGQVLNELIVVISGTIRVEAPDGRRALVGAGQHVGEAVVLRPRPIRSRIVAHEPATLLTLDGDSLIDLANQRPWLGVALLARLVERLSGDLDRLADTDVAPATAAQLLL